MGLKKLVSIFVTFVTVVLVGYVNVPKTLSIKDKEVQFLISEHDTLTLLVEKDSPGIFHYNQYYYGFVYDLMREYAYQNNVKLRIEICDNQKILNSRIKDNDVAFALAISPFNDMDYNSFLSTSLADSCKYEILGNTRNNSIKNLSHSQLANVARIIYLRGIDNIEAFSEGAKAFYSNEKSPCNYDMIDNINLLRQRKYDCVICKDEEALLYRYLFKSVVAVGKIEEFVTAKVIVNSFNTILYDDFENWYNIFSGTKSYREIYNNYFYNKYLYSFITNGYISPMFSISKYDDVFISECENTLFDWRLLSAICSIESRYTSDLVSHKGATGLMQIMPRVAKGMGISKQELYDTHTNIRCAVKLLENNVKMLNIKSQVLTDDELAILLASYNAGYGQVSDAIRLAKRYKEDTKSWEVIKRYLYKKREYKYYSQKDIVHSGCFVSDETEAYVDNVMSKYKEYLSKEIR